MVVSDDCIHGPQRIPRTVARRPKTNPAPGGGLPCNLSTSHQVLWIPGTSQRLGLVGVISARTGHPPHPEPQMPMPGVVRGSGREDRALPSRGWRSQAGLGSDGSDLEPDLHTMSP